MKLRRRRRTLEQPPRAEDILPEVQPFASDLLLEIQREIRLIRTMASTLRHVDRVQLAARHICELAVELLHVEAALVTVVTEHQTIVIASAGEKEYPQGSAAGFTESYCPIVVGTEAPLVIENSTLDPRVNTNLATTRDGVQSYLGVPLRTEDDFVIGSLCVCGCTPRRWSDKEEEILHALSRQLMSLEAEAMRSMRI